ncbi:MAG: cupin domain-containing protein [Gemmatimonadetes bacterium]|nr:cupin domain-containing protein [Candidatus Palauibacter australiensis]
MPTLIEAPAVIEAAGNQSKRIEEYAGRVRTGHDRVSAARMVAPAGWVEPGQRPEFEEITVVLRGSLRVEHEDGVIDVNAGQAVVTHPGEWVRYSTPGPEGAEYIAVCLPAFSPDTVHRDP